MSPTVAPVPSTSQADARAGRASSGVIEQTTVEAILPPTSERTELPLAIVAPSVVGVVLQAEALASQAEVATTVISQAQPDATMVVSEGAAEKVLIWLEGGK